MEWRAYALAVAGAFQRVFFIGAPGRAVLYKPYHYLEHEYDLGAAGYGFGRAGAHVERALALEFARGLDLREPDFELLTPSMLVGWARHWLIKPVWSAPEPSVEMGQNQTYDVVFHFRGMRKIGPDRRENFSATSARELVAACVAREMKCAVIGDPRQALSPQGCEDLRSRNLSMAVAALRRCRVFVGQLSGPAHLAHLVNTPVVTWADGTRRFDVFPRWNPHRAGLFVVSTHTYQPKVAQVVSAIVFMLSGKLK